MSYNQFKPDGGDGYVIFFQILICLGILFVFGVAVGLGMSVGAP